MTEEQRSILVDLEILIAVMESTDNVYCQKRLKIISKKLAKEFSK